MVYYQIAMHALIGIGLAASCGFRVFVPFLVMGLAGNAGMLELSEGWRWLGSWPAIASFAAAALIEICGYCFPWLDHLLDVMATPAAVVAGVIATAACVTGMDPVMRWSTAVIAGGGAAAAVQTLTVVTRGASTASTGGFGNWIVSLLELTLSLLVSVLAIVAPFVGIVLCVAGVLVIRRVLKRRRAKLAATTTAAAWAADRG